MLLLDNFPGDIRVEQEYKSLTRKLHNVYVLSYSNSRSIADHGFNVIELSPERKISKFSKAILTPKRKYMKEVYSVIKSTNIIFDVIHIHDLFAIPLGLYLSKKIQIQCIADLHENMPALIYDSFQETKLYENEYNIIKKMKYSIVFIYSYVLWSILEIFYLSKMNFIIVVCEEAKNRLERNGLDSTKITVVSNTKIPEAYDFKTRIQINKKFILTYMGTIGELRGLQTSMLGVKNLKESHTLNIIGLRKNHPYSMVLENLKSKNRLTNVNLIYWLNDYDIILSYLKQSDICIVPHNNTKLTQTTIPHKLFIYMSLGKPVLVSDVEPLKRVVTKARNGLIFEAENPFSFESKLLEMSEHELLKKFSKNSREAAEKEFNYIHDETRLINLYQKL